MKKVILDTHIFIWLLTGEKNISDQAKELIFDSLEEGNLYVSSISFWEIALLTKRGKIKINQSIKSWRREAFSMGMKEIQLCGDVAIDSIMLEDFHADPADRIIVSSAEYHGCTLITRDKEIISWSKNNNIKTVEG